MRPAESFIEQPIRSLQTMLRVLSEDDNKLPTVIPDGIYGPETMQAVSAFQRKTSLPVTGITDQTTWDYIVQAYEPALIRIDRAEPIEIIMNPGKEFQLNERSPYIYLLQSMLTQLSQDHPDINIPGHTGILDDQTSDSLSGFQKLAGLPVTGRLDKATWKHVVRHFTLNAHHNDSSSKNL